MAFHSIECVIPALFAELFSLFTSLLSIDEVGVGDGENVSSDGITNAQTTSIIGYHAALSLHRCPDLMEIVE